MKKYCVLPFVSVRIEDDRNLHSTRVRPCCLYNGKDMPLFDNIHEYLNSDFLKNLQQHLLTQDELPAGCNRCQAVESRNLLSVRQLKNKFFRDQTPEQTSIKELDIFPSNTCNLACVMCSPKFSSSVANEYKKLGWIDSIYNFDETDLVLETLKSLPNLEHVHIAGGEFFYGKHCLRILEAIKQANISKIEFITNGTVCDEKHLAILKDLNQVSLRFSIDGIGNYYELIRYPANWDQVQTNISQYKKQLPNAHLETAMVVQPLNIFNILDWTKWANQIDIETHYQLINGDMGWEAITEQERQQASDYILSNHKNFDLNPKQKIFLFNLAKSVLPNINYSPQARQHFVDKLTKLCKHRNVSAQTVNQVLGSWSELQHQITTQLD